MQTQAIKNLSQISENLSVSLRRMFHNILFHTLIIPCVYKLSVKI